MDELYLVFNMKSRTVLKSIFEWKWQTLIKNITSLLIFGGFAVGVFFLSRSTTQYLLLEAHIGQFLFHRFLSMVLYVFFVTINLGNMIVSYSTLYRSEEVNFLMALPIDHAKIFLIKFVDNFFYSSSTLTLVGFAVLLGYGSVFGLPWYYYFFIMFLVFLPFMLIAGIIAVMTLMLLMKIASRIGVRRLLAIIGALYVSAIYAFFKIVNPVQLVGEVMKHYPNVNDYFGYLDPPFVHYLPSHWVSEFLYWSVNGEHARALPFFTLLFLTMFGLMVGAGLMAKHLYYKSWLASSDAQALEGKKRWTLRLRFLDFGSSSFFSPQTEVLLKRDVWLFLREPSQWLHLLLMLLLLVIFLISMSTLELKLTRPFLRAVSFLVVFLFNGFLIASMTLRFVFPAVSLESESFWCVRASPLSLKKLYWHKFLISLVLVFIVAEVLSVASSSLMRGDTHLIIFGAVSSGLMALALTSLNMGAGSYFALFKEKNPIRVASSQGASLTFLVSMIYLSLTVGLLVVPLNRYFEAMILVGASSPNWLFLPLNAVALLSLLIFTISAGVGMRSIRRDL
jgi:ABC-2 type transport system permease protein